MLNVTLGRSSLQCSRLAYGCWRLAGTWNPLEVTPENIAAGRRAVIAAYEAGYTLFDHADIYCRGIAEEIFGQVLKEVPGMRDRILVATKCGIRVAGEPWSDSPHRYDFSADHIVKSCEGSLRRLGVETIDLYQLHRPDYLCNPEEVAEAFDRLLRAGKVREAGVSNFRPSLLAAVQKACPWPLVTHQVEISLAMLDCLTDGTLDQCLSEKMTPMAWSPLAGGVLVGNMDKVGMAPKHSVSANLQHTIQEVADARGVSRTVICLAWLLKHPAGIIPIVGSTDPLRIQDSTAALETELTREEWYRLLTAARGERVP